MAPGHYEEFLKIAEECFNGFEYRYKGKLTKIDPFCLAAYDLISSKEPETSKEIFFSQLPSEFIISAKSELYRADRGWIARGKKENKIVTYVEGEKVFIVPNLSSSPSVGIDSSSNLFVVCFFDNHLGGIKYIDEHLGIPKSSTEGGKEYKWNKLNPENRQKIQGNIERIMNVSCKALYAINSNYINSDNHLTHSQMAQLVDGCFTGYEKHPSQNQYFRQQLRETFFSYCDAIPTHCDPDFQKVDPGDIVRIIVRQLSYRNGRIQECTPTYATLRSHESLPIQLADVIAGCLSRKVIDDEVPPKPCSHLFFNSKAIGRKERKQGRWAKAYYWLRSD